MALDWNLAAILEKAKEQERKYGWLYSAWSYEHALRVKPDDVSFAAETWKKIGDCYDLASRKSENLDEFKKLRHLAVEAYRNAGNLFGGLKDHGRSLMCKASAEYSRSWLAPNPSEVKSALDECSTLGKEALKVFRTAKDEPNYGKACNDLLSCLWELLHFAPTEKEKRIIAEDGVHYSNEAVSVLSALNNKPELLLAYSLASRCCWYSSNINEQEEKRQEQAQRSLEYSEKALALSKEVNNPYYTAMAKWSATLSTLFFTDRIEDSLHHAEEMLQQGAKVDDNYLKGVASYLLAFVTDWMVPREVNPDRKEEKCKEIIKYSEDATHYLEPISRDAVIGETYMFYVQSYSTLASEFATKPLERLDLSKKAVEIGRKGLEYAVRSGSPDAIGSIRHTLSKALHSYSNLEPRRAEKARLLQEALDLRNGYLEIVEKTFPSNYWILGLGKVYAAQLKAELAKLETEEDRTIAFLRGAASDIEDGVSNCEKWILHRPSPPLITTVAEYEDWFGRILEELHAITKEEKSLRKATMVYTNAAEKFERVDLSSRVAESFWRIARNQDQLGENLAAAESFHKAFKGYDVTARKIPSFSDFFTDYGSYMRAWSEIEKAKSAHANRDYGTAKKHYNKAVRLLNRTKRWNHLSSNFRAWAILEQAESLSRREKNTKAIRAFNKAARLFREVQTSLHVAADEIRNEDEQYLIKALVEVSDTRRSYCLGRVALEEARILDRQGDHVAGSEKYGSAAKAFQSISKDGPERTARELQPIVFLCRAWQRMLMAEAKTSTELYEEAAKLFEKVHEYSSDQTTSLLALAHSNFCHALVAGTEFEITRDVKKYSEAKKFMEVAASYYLKSGFDTAAEYANGTQRLLDAYVLIENAKAESDPTKKAKYFMMAEKVLQFSAASFRKAQHQEKTTQVQQLSKKVKEERELAVMLKEIFQAPTIVSSTQSFVTPTASAEEAVGLGSFEGANIQANLISRIQQVGAGEGIPLELHIANVGKESVILSQIDQILPAGFELLEQPDYCHLEDSHLNLKGRRLDRSKTEEITMVLRSFDQGAFEVKPSILYMDESGQQLLCEPAPVTIEVSEAVPQKRIATGCEDLDNLLLGGLPETYPVILTSPFCDERDLLIRRFLEVGVENADITFYVTVDPGELKNLAAENQSSFQLFICNPNADKIVEASSNVFGLEGVEKLTNINIALTKAIRELKESEDRAKRICIEIVSDILLQHNAVQTRRWLTELVTELRARGFTTLAVMNPLMHPPQDVQAILGLFEGEIAIYDEKTREGSRKLLKVKRLYNQKYVDSAVPLQKEKM